MKSVMLVLHENLKRIEVVFKQYDVLRSSSIKIIFCYNKQIQNFKSFIPILHENVNN